MKAGGGGFGGRGFKFDETEANIASDRKKVQAAALGITHDGGEDEGPADVIILYSTLPFADYMLTVQQIYCILSCNLNT